MTRINNFTLFVLTICLPFLFFNCGGKQVKKTDCSGFQDTLLKKFVYKTVDSVAAPEGGAEKISKLISKNLKYPPGHIFLSDKVVIAFVVETNGTIDGGRTISEPSGKEHLFSNQVFNILKSVKWKPAKCNGELVPSIYLFSMKIAITQ